MNNKHLFIYDGDDNVCVFDGYVCSCICVPRGTHMEPEDSFVESVPSFHLYTGSGD